MAGCSVVDQVEQRWLGRRRLTTGSTAVLQALRASLHLLAPAHQLAAYPAAGGLVAAPWLAIAGLKLVDETAPGDLAVVVFALFLNVIVIA